MDKLKKILEWVWLIVKLVFMIAAIIVGIKLIVFLIFPFLPFSILTFSHFSSFDWNPIATIFGSLIMGIITYLAIYETSKQDRKNRDYEYRNTFYNNKLVELYDCIDIIELLNDRFFNLQISSGFTVKQDLIDRFYSRFYEFKKILNYLTLLNSNSIFTKFYKEQIPSLENSCEFLRSLEEGKEIKEGECLKLFEHYLVNNEKLEKTDFTNKLESIIKLKEEIKNNLKLDEK